MRGLRAAALLCAGLAGALAWPAAAAPTELRGDYFFRSLASHKTATVDGEPYPMAPEPDVSAVWTLTPCGHGCTTVRSQANGWSENLHLIEGRWQMTRPGSATTMTCDGAGVPSTLEYSLDAAALSGTLRNIGRCRTQAVRITTPIALTKP